MKWTILEEFPSLSKNGKLIKKGMFVCICECGEIKEIRKSSYGRDSFSCKRCSNAKRKHMLSHTRIYNIWSAMKQRCYYKNHISRKYYSDKNITVCIDWKNDFSSFLNWSVNNGYKDDLSIDRINNDGNYEPENCRWIKRGDQNKNQKSNINITHNGKTMILKDWCRELNLNYDAVRNRIYKGKTHKQALELE